MELKKNTLWIICAFFLFAGNLSYFLLQNKNKYLPNQPANHGSDTSVRYIIENLVNVTQDPTNATKVEMIAAGLRSKELYPCPSNPREGYLCQNYTYSWKNKTDIKHLLEERIQQVRQRCKDYHRHLFNASLSKYGTSENPSTFEGVKRILVSKRLNLALCWIPKTASTFMNSVWFPLSAAPADFSHIRRVNNSHITESRCRIKDFWKQELNIKAEERFVTFVMVRNPWQRLVSVYREKCEQEDKSYTCKLDFGKNCSQPKGVKITFERFLQCVIDRMMREETEYFGHVETSYRRCGVCDYPYRYVVLMENMENELEYIFKQAGLTDPVGVMHAVRTKTIRPIEKTNQHVSYIDYWKQVPSQMIEKIRFLYRYELQLYDYPETPFIIQP